MPQRIKQRFLQHYSKIKDPPPTLNSRYPPLLCSCSVFPEGDLDWASPDTSSLCGCTSEGAAEAGQCSGSCHHQHGKTTCQSINQSIDQNTMFNKLKSINTQHLKNDQHTNWDF